MRKVPLLIALCLLSALTAHSQNTTVVTGTITDANGIPYSGATVYIELTPAIPAGTITGAMPAGFVCCQPETTTTDKNGYFTKLLGSNAAMQAGKQWKFTVTEPGIAAPMGTGAQTFTVTITISGAAQDVSATLSASAPNLSNGTGVVSPVIDITDRRYRGKCDDTTADDAALELALAAVPQTATNNGAVIFFPRTCKFTAKHTTSKNNVTFRGIGGWQYIAQSVPGAFLDYTGTDNFLEITGQGIRFQDINIKAPNVLAAIVPPVIAGGNFTLTSSGSGTLSSTEYFQVVYLNNNILGSDRGSTVVSNEITVNAIGTNCVTIASPPATGDADNYEVFMGATSGNNVRVTAPIAIGTPVQICAAVNLGVRPRNDTSAKAAVYTTSAPTFDNASIFSGNIGAFGVGGDGIVQSVGSGPLVRHSKIEGFSVGEELGAGQNIARCAEQSVFERNGWDLVVGNGGGIDIDSCVFQFSSAGHIKLIDTNEARIVGSYFEMNVVSEPILQLGDTSVPTISNKTVGPIATDFSSNYVSCTSVPWTTNNSAIEIVQLNGFTPGSVRIGNNTFSGCQNQLIIDNQAQIATAGIDIRGNIAFNSAFSASACNSGQCGWLTNAGSPTGATTGVLYDDNDFVSNTSLVPTTPSFSSLSINGSPLAVIPLVFSSAPSWLRAYGDGSAGAVNCNGNINIAGGTGGEFWVSSFTVSAGNTCSLNAANTGLVIRSTGTITIAGTLNATSAASNNGTGDYGGSGGGGGGGTLAGGTGSTSTVNGQVLANGGAAGASSGGTAGVGNIVPASKYLPGISANPFPRGAGSGATGGSSGGAGGGGGVSMYLVAPTIDFQSTGVIDVSGFAGAASAANATGAGGGGGGYVVLSAVTYTNNLGTTIVQGGPGGANENPAVVLTVPASGLGNITTSGTGAFAHASTFAGGNPTVITVDAAGSGYNYTPTCAIVGNGGGANTGANATCTVTMAGASPNKTVSSIAVAGGNAGYGSGTIYTTSGLGGYGALGWAKSLTIQ